MHFAEVSFIESLRLTLIVFLYEARMVLEILRKPRLLSYNRRRASFGTAAPLGVSSSHEFGFSDISVKGILSNCRS
jgi:hypothetical protein